MAGSCKRAFVIGIDGAGGRFVRQAHTPNIDALVANGAATYHAQTVLPSISFPAWGSMFHGVAPDKHGIDGVEPCAEGTPWPSFLKLAYTEWPDMRSASFSGWEPINTHVIEPSVPCLRVSKGDPELTAAAVAYISEAPPDVYFMQLEYVDLGGHEYGYGTPRYLERFSTADSQVGEVLDAIREAGVLDESLIILLSDHGGIDDGHGCDHPDCMTTFWSASGPGVASGVELDGDVSIMDTAAVVAHALGLPRPAGWDAKVPNGVFV